MTKRFNPDDVAKELCSVQPLNPRLMDSWFNDVKIIHDTSGDSTFTFTVNMEVGATYGNDSTVKIGGIRFNIHKLYSEEQKKDYFILQETSYDVRIYNSPEFYSKEDAIKWLINYIRK